MSLSYLQLQDRVLFNAFDSARYRDYVKTWLNDGLLDAWRRLELGETRGVFGFEQGGVVAQTFLRVDNVWLSSGDGAVGEYPYASRARYQLRRLPNDASIATPEGQEPTHYQLTTVTGTPHATVVTVTPAPASGAVAIEGLTAPVFLDGDNDQTGSSELDELMIAYARMRAFQAEDDFQNASGWQAEYERALRNVGLSKHAGNESPQTPGDPAYL